MVHPVRDPKRGPVVIARDEGAHRDFRRIDQARKGQGRGRLRQVGLVKGQIAEPKRQPLGVIRRA
jgi:hypothetical protein